MTLTTPFHYDYVGSFLRPEKLKQAREAFTKGTISREQLTETENECITELVSKLKELGYHVITDGEFRRSAWHLDFMWGFAGMGHSPAKYGLPFHGEQAMIDDTYLIGKLGLEGEHPFVNHYRFVKQFEDENTIAKQTIPAPAQFLAQLIMPFAKENTKKRFKKALHSPPHSPLSKKENTPSPTTNSHSPICPTPLPARRTKTTSKRTSKKPSKRGRMKTSISR